MTARERLLAYLERNNLTQADFARESGFSTPFVSQLLSGERRPSLAKAAHLERLTGIPTIAWAENSDTETAMSGGSGRGKR